MSLVPSLFLVPKWENSHNIEGRATSGFIVLHVRLRCIALYGLHVFRNICTCYPSILFRVVQIW